MKPNDRVRATHPESTGMPPSMELPEKEQELIRAIRRENSDADACARALVDEYDWGLAKVKRYLKKANGGIQ